MKKTLLLLIYISLSISFSSAQTLWSNSWGGSGFDYSESMEVDNQGNIVVGGVFYGLVDFDPGDESHWVQGLNFSDIFIEKFDNQGNLIWVEVILSDQELTVDGIFIDENSDIYLVGQFYETVDFDPGPLTNYEIAAGSSEAFILKLNQDGDFQWVNVLHGNSNEIIVDIQGDSNGDILLSGNFAGTVDFDSGIGENIITAQGISDGFIQKINSSGELIWTKIISNIGSVKAVRLGINNEEDVFLIGDINETTDFDPGTEEQNYTPSLEKTTFLLSLNSLGEFNWYNIGESTDKLNYADLKFDGDDNIYLTGRYRGSSDFDPGSGVESHSSSDYSVFAMKLDNLGDYQWVKFIEGTGNSGIKSMELDSDYNILLMGSFMNTVDFDPGPAEVFIEDYINNLYVLSLDQNGEFNSVFAFDYTDLLYLGDLAFSNSDDFYLLGFYTDSLDIDLSEEVDYTVSNGYTDLFMMKIGYSLAIEDTPTDMSFNIYPNPCLDYFIITTNIVKGVDVELYDQSGKKVYHKSHYGDQHKIDLENLVSGVYILRIRSVNGQYAKKLVVK